MWFFVNFHLIFWFFPTINFLFVHVTFTVTVNIRSWGWWNSWSRNSEKNRTRLHDNRLIFGFFCLIPLQIVKFRCDFSICKNSYSILFQISFWIKKITTILTIIFSDILMFDKTFVSPQVKRIVIISNKHGMYELPHQLPNNLRLKNLGN